MRVQVPPSAHRTRGSYAGLFFSYFISGVKTVKRSLIFIFITVFVDMLGYSMILPLLPFFVQAQGGDAVLAGGLQSLYAFLQLFSGPILGSLSDRYGRKPILVACLFGTALAYTLFGLANSILFLFLAVLLDGLTGNNLSTSFTYVADITTAEERSRGMGIVSAAFGLGLMAGPALGGLLSDYGLFVPAFAAAGIAFANTIYGIFILPESLPPELRSQHKPTLNFISQLQVVFNIQNIRLLLLSVFFLNFAFAGLQTNFPLFSNARFDWDARQNGLLFAFVGTVSVFVQGFLFGRLQPKIGEVRLSILGLVCLSLGMAGIALATESWMIYPIVAFAAFGSSISIPAISGMISNRAPANEQGRLMGGNQVLFSLTAILGPAVAGISFERIGISAPYWIGSGLALIALYFAFRDSRLTSDV
jgi:DHA1 family tetracycline resistance protein-like MFS transporter